MLKKHFLMGLAAINLALVSFPGVVKADSSIFRDTAGTFYVCKGPAGANTHDCAKSYCLKNGYGFCNFHSNLFNTSGYVAIAVSRTRIDVAANGYTVDEVKQLALQRCQERSPNDLCQIVMTYYDNVDPTIYP
jgi:Domain of unknown function (DUF4189)